MQKYNQTIITAKDSNTISIRDRGFNYGDGFFTTAKVVDHCVEHWLLHQARLIECASRLGFPALDFDALTAEVNRYIKHCELGVLKIVVTRGEGGRGYALPTCCHISIVLSLTDFPAHYLQLQQQGISLGVSPVKLALQPALAGLKTLNRLEQVLIKKAMQQQQYDDVVVLDSHDRVIEASAANIFIIKNQQVYSPQLTECGIKGVFIQSLCDKLAIEFQPLLLNDLLNADALFICNSLMGVVAVNRVNEQQFSIKNSVSLLQQLLAKEAKC